MAMIVALATFCTLLTAIAVLDLARADARDFVEIGETMLVIGITTSTWLWATVDLSIITRVVALSLGILAVGAAAGGVVLIVRYW